MLLVVHNVQQDSLHHQDNVLLVEPECLFVLLQLKQQDVLLDTIMIQLQKHVLNVELELINVLLQQLHQVVLKDIP